LTLPMLIRFFDRRRLVTIAMEAIVFAPVLRLACYSFWPNHALTWFVLMPCRADALFFGVLGAVVMRDAVWKARIVEHKNLLHVLLAIFAIGVPFVTQTDMMANGLLMVSVMLTWLAAFFLLVLIYAMSFPDSLLSRCLRWSWLRWLGMIAYGLYLLHILMLSLAVDYLRAAAPTSSLARQMGAAVLGVGITLVLASLSWRYFEKPLVARGHRLVYESANGTKPAAGTITTS
jgi:peptidoglycan/LPS O-acetylase OafA/YrhL